MATERMVIGGLTLSIDEQPFSTAVWVNGGQSRVLLALGDTRDEAVREAVERLEAFTAALQQPSPAELAKMSEGKP